MKKEKCKRVFDMKRICGKQTYTLPQRRGNEYMLLLRFVLSGRQNFCFNNFVSYYIGTERLYYISNRNSE